MSYYRLAVKNSKHSSVNRKSRKKRFAIFAALFVASILAVTVAVYLHSMTPTVLAVAQAEIKSVSIKAVNDAVYSVMSESVGYGDLITVDKNSDGEVTLIRANSVLINSLAKNTAVTVQKKVNELGYVGVNVPIGTLSGIPLLSGAGPNVTISVKPIGAVICDFFSKFETAGINQTLHRIYLNVTTRVDVIIPTSSTVVETVTPVLVSESIIVGKVPQAFLQGGQIGSTQSGK